MLIDYIIELLGDGKWHYVRTLARKLGQPEEKIRDVLRFCAEFRIVTLDGTDKVKLDEAFKRLLA